MKKFLPLLVLLVFMGLSLISCQSGPEKIAEDYMKIHCKLGKLNEKYETASQEERVQIDKEIESVQQEAIILNDEIQQKHGQDTAALSVIQYIYINYQCPE